MTSPALGYASRAAHAPLERSASPSASPTTTTDDNVTTTAHAREYEEEIGSFRRPNGNVCVERDEARGGGDIKLELERASERCIRHILERGSRANGNGCSVRLREIQTSSDACAVMIKRERTEIAQTRAEISLEAHMKKMKDVLSARHVMVESLVRSGLMNRFSCVTTALAVAYLDYFITMSGYIIGNNSFWLYQLVACACMLIAVKFEEPLENVHPDISSRLQQTSDISFDHVAVSKMEAIVLRELNWSVSRVTPYQYVPYFLCLVDGQSFIRGDAECTSLILRRAEVLSLMILYDVNILSQCESSIIAKAILCITLAEQCGEAFGESCIAETIVTQIMHHLNENDDMELEMVNARVWECMCMMTSFTSALKSIVRKTSCISSDVHSTSDQSRLKMAVSE